MQAQGWCPCQAGGSGGTAGRGREVRVKSSRCLGKKRGDSGSAAMLPVASHRQQCVSRALLEEGTESVHLINFWCITSPLMRPVAPSDHGEFQHAQGT